MHVARNQVTLMWLFTGSFFVTRSWRSKNAGIRPSGNWSRWFGESIGRFDDGDLADSLIDSRVEPSQLQKEHFLLWNLIRSPAKLKTSLVWKMLIYMIIDTLGLLSWFLLKLSAVPAVPISIPVLLVGFACHWQRRSLANTAARMSPPESAELPWWAWHHHRDLEAGSASLPTCTTHLSRCPRTHSWPWYSAAFHAPLVYTVFAN